MTTPDLTILLEQVGAGDERAPERLYEAVYAELRQLAIAKMAAERPNHTLQATALVNEAFLRLIGNQDQLTHRGHFFGAAARAMERVLVDHARERAAQKRGGGSRKVSFDELRGIGVPEGPGKELGVLEVHEAVERLEATDEALALVVRYRYFLGMRLEDIAAVTGVSLSTVRRQSTYARAWLYAELSPEAQAAPEDPPERKTSES